MKKEDIIGCALEAGIMISTGYGQRPHQLIPASDEGTLINFANLLFKRNGNAPRSNNSTSKQMAKEE